MKIFSKLAMTEFEKHDNNQLVVFLTIYFQSLFFLLGHSTKYSTWNYVDFYSIKNQLRSFL